MIILFSNLLLFHICIFAYFIVDNFDIFKFCIFSLIKFAYNKIGKLKCDFTVYAITCLKTAIFMTYQKVSVISVYVILLLSCTVSRLQYTINYRYLNCNTKNGN